MSRRRLGPVIPAVVLILLGGLFLLDNLDILRVDSVWDLAWPGILVLLGLWWLASGRRFLGLVFIVLGGIFLGTNTDVLPEDVWSTWWPLFLVGGGLWLLFGWRGATAPHRRWRRNRPGNVDSSETLDVNVLFGEEDRVVTSTDFQGGSVTVTFGEVKLDLRQASLGDGGASLDASVTFGELDIRVPRTWVVHVDGRPFLGEIADKRTARPVEGPAFTITASVTFGELKIED